MAKIFSKNGSSTKKSLRVLLRRVRGKARAMGDGASRNALHDFRIALRALRSCLEFDESLLDRRKRASLLTQLNRSFAATNATRDTEAQLELVTNLGKEIRSEERQASSRLKDALKQKLDRQLLKFDRRWVAKFEGLIERVAESAEGAQSRDDAQDKPKHSQQALKKAGKRLAKLVRAIKRRKQEKAIHRARIAAKRLRYVLEAHGKKGSKLHGRCEKAQDLLGELHDLQVFRKTLRKATTLRKISGYKALRDAARAEERRRFNKFRRNEIFSK